MFLQKKRKKKRWITEEGTWLKRWAVFISLKAKQTTQTKSVQNTTLHTNESERQLPRLATLFLSLFVCCLFPFVFSCSTLKIEVKLQTPLTSAEKTKDKQTRSVLSRELCDAWQGNVCLYRHSWHSQGSLPCGRATSHAEVHLWSTSDRQTLLFLECPDKIQGF